MPIATPQGTLDFKSVDKVTFVGASSNTVIDTTTGSLGVGVGVGGPTSNLHVVGHTRLEGDINMLHTSNTASIKLNSNVVTEFPRSKKLIKYPRVNLSSASQDGYVVSSTTNYYDSNNPLYPWQVFNSSNYRFQSARSDYSSTDGNYTGTVNQTNVDGNLVGGEWIQLQLPNKISLNRFTVALNMSTHGGRMGKSYTLTGSNDGSTWTTVSTHTQSYGNGADGSDFNHDVESTTMYTYYRLIATSTFAAEGPYGGAWALTYWKLFGTPEYDPDADGVDVVVKSEANVPNTDWLEVYYDAKDLTSISGTIADLSGKSVAGTLNGDVSLDTSNNVKSFSFDGSGDYISGTLTNTGDFDFTVSTWMFETNDTTTNTVWMIGSGSSSNNPNPSVALAIDSNGSLDFFVFSGIQIRMSNFRHTFGINKWHHIVCTRIGTTLKYFINGVDQVRPVTNSDTLSIAANSVFNIGARTGNQLGNNPMHGKIANFRLYNRALTQDEIYQLYAYQKEYFGHGDLSMTLKAGRLGIGTSEPKAALDVRGDIHATGSLNPVAGMWTQSIDSSTVTTTIITNIGSCMSTKTPDGYGTAPGFSGSAGIFVAPYDGIYQFQFFVMGQSRNSNLLLVFNANGPSVIDGTWGGKNIIGDYREILDLRGVTNLEEVHGFSTLLNMSKGDTVDIQNHSTGYLGNDLVRCSCFLVHRT